MQVLYPAIQPYTTQRLKVDSLHTLYLEECGNPEGIPVLFVHGGPGAGCEPRHRCFFDPQHYRVILFDQRGCGRSTPHAELKDNTTGHLVADMEAIRRHLGIERWLIFGGSWGSTLGLVYAQTHPERVTGLILRGIFLGRPRDVEWFYQDGASRIFPDAWQDFIDPIPVSEREQMVTSYHRRLTGDNEIERMRLAKSWSLWEGRALSLERRSEDVTAFGDGHRALSLARIEADYFVNNCWLKPNQILAQIGRLDDIPGCIVQGRYDMITPVDGAWELANAWAGAELKIVSPAGHAATEAPIVDGLISATREFARLLA